MKATGIGLHLAHRHRSEKLLRDWWGGSEGANAIDVFDTLRIFRFLHQRLSAEERGCLVTVTDVTGASVRNPGAHMGVSAGGEYRGSLSGGCIEKAVVAEALEAIAAQAPRQVAYGAGSPVIDIRLPCGGRVDLLFTPLADASLIEQALASLERRMPCTLALPTNESEPHLAELGDTGWAGGSFNARHVPPLRLLVAGHGGSVEALVRQAHALDIGCEVATPDEEIIGQLAGVGCKTSLLARLTDALPAKPDPWTAVVFYFHDHDWEAHLLKQALASPAFFIGAMGSRSTHETRCKGLREMGLSDDEVARIVAPIGLIPSSRDPDTLALSTLAQVVDRYNRLIGAHRNRRV